MYDVLVNVVFQFRKHTIEKLIFIGIHRKNIFIAIIDFSFYRNILYHFTIIPMAIMTFLKYIVYNVYFEKILYKTTRCPSTVKLLSTKDQFVR